MLDLIKRIIIFGIGVYVIIFIGRTLFGDFSFTRFSKDISDAAKELSSIGRIGQNSTSSRNNINTSNTNTDINFGSNNTFNTVSDTPTKPNETTKGSENAVSLRNLSRGNIVAQGQVIDGSAPGNWFFDGVSVVRFYDDRGSLLGTSQMRAQGDTKNSVVAFTVVAQFTQGSAETGTAVFEKANTTGLAKNDARYAFPITYPVRNNTNNTNTQNTNTVNSNTVNTQTNTQSNNGLPSPSITR